MVLRQHLSLEGPNAAVGRDLRELTDEDRAQPLSLAHIGDREAHFGAIVADPRVLRVPNDPLLFTNSRDQTEPPCLFDVGLSACLSHQRFVAQLTTEAEPARLLREATEELTNYWLVVRVERAHADDRSVPQHDRGRVCG